MKQQEMVHKMLDTFDRFFPSECFDQNRLTLAMKSILDMQLKEGMLPPEKKFEYKLEMGPNPCPNLRLWEHCRG